MNYKNSPLDVSRLSIHVLNFRDEQVSLSPYFFLTERERLKCSISLWLVWRRSMGWSRYSARRTFPQVGASSFQGGFRYGAVWRVTAYTFNLGGFLTENTELFTFILAFFSWQHMLWTVLRIRILIDTHHFGNLDQHQIKIRICIK